MRIDSKPISLLEMSTDGLLLSLPSRSCAEGHEAEVHIRVHNRSETPLEYLLIAKVVEIDHAEDEDRVRLQVNGTSSSSWQEFKGLYESRQAEVTGFLRKVKGY